MDKMEVFKLMSHLIVTVVLVIGYLVLRLKGITDDSFTLILPVMIGYWFGAVRVDTSNKKQPPSDGGAQ